MRRFKRCMKFFYHFSINLCAALRKRFNYSFKARHALKIFYMPQIETGLLQIEIQPRTRSRFAARRFRFAAERSQFAASDAKRGARRTFQKKIKWTDTLINTKNSILYAMYYIVQNYFLKSYANQRRSAKKEDFFTRFKQKTLFFLFERF